MKNRITYEATVAKIKRLEICFLLVLFFLYVRNQTVHAQQIKYDQLGRVEQVTYENGDSVQYQYDANGNMTEAETNIITKPEPTKEPGTTKKPNPGNGSGSQGETGTKRGQDTTDKPEITGTPQKTPDPGKPQKTLDPGKPQKTAKKGMQIKTKTAIYKITSVKGSRTVCYQRPRKNYRKIVIPDTITYLGKKYKVTAIKAGACRKQPKLKQVVIGKNVKTIGKQAFYQCKKLKKVQIKSKCLQKVGKQAFQRTHRKIVIKMPKGKRGKYKTIIKIHNK